MAIAILGWGSLLWDLDDLAPHVRLPWRMQGGPRLPMEFSRISPKRKMGLVVCLDVADGTPCPTHAIPSTRATLAEARADLAARERTPLDQIGYASAGESFGRLPDIVSEVQSWCAATGYEGAVWTDLAPNFTEVTKNPFTLPAAIAYLQTLQGENLEEAHRYITSAPTLTNTPLRRALAQDPWWQGL